MPSLRILRIGPGATVQDLGRPGRMHMGVPPGGAMVPGLLVAANLAAGAPPEAAAIELPLHGARFQAQGALRVAIDGVPTELVDGQTVDVIPAANAVRYLAVAGGLDLPCVAGGRGTLGSVEPGAPMLRAGDVLQAGVPGVPHPVDWSWPDPEAAVRLVQGPDAFPPEALDALLRGSFRVDNAMDRTGTRLTGPRIEFGLADRKGSAPMVRGAMEVTRDGALIVLGPDHPTTGGYPVIGVVVRADLGALASRRPGAAVRFASVTPCTAPPAG